MIPEQDPSALPDAHDEPTPWLTRGGAAYRMRCSERQVDYLIATGALPVYRRGRMVRLHVDDVDRYLFAGQQIGPGAA